MKRATAILFLLLWTSSAFAVQFPQGFKWCVATAAHQIEGDNVNSDWWDFEQIPGHIDGGQTSGKACDSWNRGSQDIDAMKYLGVSTYRFSVEWAKIEPVEGTYDQGAIEHYAEEVRNLRAAHIDPFITLHHFTLPRWVRAKGGWEWDGSTDAFARFVELVYTRIAPGVRDWVTFNEPMVHIMGGYIEGVTPPGEKRELSGIVPVLRGLLKAHARAYAVLHRLADEQGADVRVGMAHHLRTFDPYFALNPLDLVATSISDDVWNWAIPDALESGRMQMHALWLLNADEEIPGLAGTQDFVGVNYYTGDLIQFSFTDGIIRHTRDNLPKNDLGWDLYPDGMYEILSDVADRYSGKPVIITENGIADSKDSQRPQFLKDHLQSIADAIADGVPVEGYCHWSLMDNFEWVNGFTPRFGLFETNYQTYERTPRPSAELYRQIIQQNGF
jgi:beta-glucosidase